MVAARDPTTSLLDRLCLTALTWQQAELHMQLSISKGFANILFLSKTYFSQFSESFSVFSFELVIKKPLNIILNTFSTPL